MDRLTISDNLSSWLRAISGAIGILLLTAFLLWNNENEKSSTLIQEIKADSKLNSMLRLSNQWGPSPIGTENDQYIKRIYLSILKF